MAVVYDQKITEQYAIYHGDCMDVMGDMQDQSIDFSLYSPPFAGIYQYSSDARDMSNCISYKEFLTQYAYAIYEVSRLTKPGRISAVHCTDIPKTNQGCDAKRDFPGDVIRLHTRRGFDYVDRVHIWKEPLTVRNRTMMKSLHHSTLCSDSTKVSIAGADYLLIFRRRGQNAIPVEHLTGLYSYAGARQIPSDILHYRGMEGDQKQNKFSHWIWRQYASAFWDDIRIDRVLPYRESRELEDEKHVHPLQLDVIERAVILWSNPGEVVFTPFMGVGSEVYGSVVNHRKGIGVELKASYYRQAYLNLEVAMLEAARQEQLDILDYV